MRTVEAKVATPRKVAFLSRHGWPWMRQTANGSGHHEGLEISLVAAEDDDWLVVFDDIAQPVPTRVPRSRRILFVTEPPGQKRYRPRAVNQFGTLVSPYRIDGFQGHWIASQPAINWFYGVSFEKGGLVSRLGLEHLRAMQVPEPKASRISVVCSTKRRLPGHRARLELLRILNMGLDTEIELSDPLLYRPLDPPSAIQALAQARDSRPEMKSQLARDRAGQLNSDAAKYARLPTVQGFGDYGVIGTSPGSGLPTRVVGLRVNIPLWDGG
ncbi:MAG: TolC family protein, partial [Hyphomicrobium sp.]|nr:TolC family protein [Hyphomicrobium sp.]